jgi:hypothetical protein
MMSKYFKGIKLANTAIIAGAAFILILQTSAFAADKDEAVVVNVDNFARAETAAQFDRMLQLLPVPAVNTILHLRNAVALDSQNVIRMNRDTIYSAAITDISEGATLTIPDLDGRYMSVMVVNEDHYVNKVYDAAGTYKLTMKEFDTPYVQIALRTLVNASDPADIKKVNALQDQVILKAASAKPYTHPTYDEKSYKATYDALVQLGRGVTDFENSFGKKEDVTEVRHLIGSAIGWGGLPEEEAYYVNVEPNLPVGAYQITVKDVPVDAFWSISMYNKEGFFEENEYAAYSVNNISGTPNEDGSFTIHFGGDPKSVNYLHLTEGWNYLIRFYQPHKEILEGAWTFPKVMPVK